MNLLQDVAKELVGMFIADVRLACAILLLVAVVALSVEGNIVAPVIGGTALLIGCLAIVVAVTVIEARRHSN